MLACPPAQWTSIAFDSTPEVPKLTAAPDYIATKWVSTMSACSDVGVASMVDEADQTLTLEAIVAMTAPGDIIVYDIGQERGHEILSGA